MLAVKSEVHVQVLDFFRILYSFHFSFVSKQVLQVGKKLWVLDRFLVLLLCDLDVNFDSPGPLTKVKTESKRMSLLGG